jgi:hypothetical protein
MAQAIRVLKYLAAHPDGGITFDGNRPVTALIYADASHAIYATGYGQGGMIIFLGSGAIYCRSFKLKSVTRSSSES